MQLYINFLVCACIKYSLIIPLVKSATSRSHRKEGAQNRPLLCLPFFFFFARPLFSFLVLRALFWEPSFRPLFFFYNNFCLKTVFFRNFSRVFARVLFRPPFFFLLKAPSFFFFFMEGSLFFALFSPSLFFSALLSMGPMGQPITQTVKLCSSI